jgi:DNA helicase-2/ATP-dependent DNA helicase PcrA
MKHLDGLNDAQKEAVLHTEGPLLVLAGAGAGKTRVITHRILEIIRKGAAPQSILAVTFTNKAAKEMRERTRALLSESPEISFPVREYEMPLVTTFHSLGLLIIKENAKRLGLTRTPAIFDRSDSMRAIKEAMKEVGVSTEEFEPRSMLSRISREKGNGTSLSQYMDAVGNGQDAISRVWERYEAILRDEKAVDFDDLLLRATRLLRDDAPVREAYQKRFQYLLIDEYQDTNRVQNEMAEHLTGPARNICAVGDIDQNIYSWRGAELQHILSFDKKYPGAKIILLEENYRSTQTILTAANDIIKKNKYRAEKNLFTKNGAGDAITLYGGYDETDEAGFIARRASELIEAGASPRDIAVLFRANFQSRALEEAFLNRDIPYQVLGVKFFERKEVKDLLCLIRAGLEPTSGADIKRIANVPPRGIGKVTLLAMLSNKETELRGATAEKVASFRRLLTRIGEQARANRASEVVKFALKESGLEQHLKEGDSEDRERLENCYELVSLATRYDQMPPLEGVEKLLEDAALASDQDELKEDADAVRLMTVHASKGLEFPYIFISGLEEGLFPYERSVSENGKISPEEGEEERRLFYVALTRAMKRVCLTYATMRTMYGSKLMGSPSSFITDIPGDLIEDEAPERLGRTIYLD